MKDNHYHDDDHNCNHDHGDNHDHFIVAMSFQFKPESLIKKFNLWILLIFNAVAENIVTLFITLFISYIIVI